MTKARVMKILTYVLLTMPIVLMIANNIVLLNLHDLTYYYTPRGMLLSTAVMAIESPIWFVCLRTWRKVLGLKY